jgi:hypothetical protein
MLKALPKVVCSRSKMEIPVQVRLFLVVVTLLLLFSSIARADTLYLKNGMYIVVTRATEKDGEIEYWVGSTKYTISKDMVAKIEPGDGPSPRGYSGAPGKGSGAGMQDLSRREPSANPGIASHDKLQLPVPGGPKQHDPYWASLRTRIVQGDRVNEMRLAEIELDHDAHTTSNAYFLAGVTEMQDSDPGKASIYFENALRARRLPNWSRRPH